MSDNGYGELLDAIGRITATDHRLTISREGSDQYIVRAIHRGSEYGFSAMAVGNTISHPIIDLADRIAPGAK